MLRFFFMGKRYFGSSYLTKRLKTINERALKYHIDYTKSLDILEGKNRSENDENKGLLEEDMEILDINKIKDKYEYEMKI
ncbi:hypothetical protein PFLG_03169 [Plasmodium falciparum RAJ116]|uniref:Uncharacterized protein n=1 Tax=Plasmodium falciparum RAJ116 TaxID=580058 RepID=A0A0L0D3H6_PLAFA|nr:hypothetical protein PFLG_03169 [Plasmodium falciparum RAJ116]